MEREESKRILECLLFVASEPLSEKRLMEISGVEPRQLRMLLDELTQEYAGRGFTLRRLAGGWQFATQADHAPYIEKLYRPKMQQLSRAAMETLAIIAYKQPVTRAEVASIRQVEVDGIISNLLDKRLIREVGRRVGPGRALLYGTTDEFLSFFGLNSLDDLPAPVELLPVELKEEDSLFSEEIKPALEIAPPLTDE